MIAAALIVFGYLLGSISSAIIACRLMGLPDPRTEGSRNPGATNVLRFGGKKAGAVSLAGDMLKGVIPVVVAHLVGVEPLIVGLTALAAFLGHLYPVFFGFKGGKGVATMLGALLGIHFWVGLATCGVWLFMAFVVKVSSAAALVATASAPFWMWWLTGSAEWVVVTAAMTVMLYWRHRSNIRNLIEGTEGKIQGPDQEPPADSGGTS
ncbi:MAG: glycerol-3-phosphate 1-O-acyltransferase [Proteobacteria bacterium]|nr:MAG: glycerol-3-phosphate 1-O-acyltransferase [Pseudomonadota bacterium]QKK10445.1 MAG: glycerol-3-phosphate 1-O-acyltransferase PlsY [Pseudomonadota bacterium]